MRRKISESARSVVVAVDAMGGDTAPKSPVEGAVIAVRRFKLPVILVGDEKLIRDELERHKASDLKIKIVHSDLVAGTDNPARDALSGKNTTIKTAFDLVASGEARAVFSAGNTGASFTVSMVSSGKIEGIDRPAVAATLPGLRGDIVLVDAGANPECRPNHLLQFGIMGTAFAEETLKIESPRVGLLSNGIEASKGTETTRQAGELLRASGLNFVGYVEGNEIMSGRADVIVTDGFSGNLVLKSIEGVAEFIVDSLSDIFIGGALNRLGLALLRDRIHEFRKTVDYAEYGGAPLLGVNSTCVIGHGRSTPMAVANAIGLAAEFEASGYRAKLKEWLSKNANGKADETK